MSPRTNRSTYCRDQAEECALRSSLAAVPEIRDAYLQLELGWRQLVADFDPAPSIGSDASSRISARRLTNRCLNENTGYKNHCT